jgi:hypothetical protein
LRYASAAVKPSAGRATTAVKERVANAVTGDRSLKERLDPTQVAAGGRVGDAADALLAKFGKPGKLAAKAGMGSRAVERVLPTPKEDHEDEDAPDLESEADAEAAPESDDTLEGEAPPEADDAAEDEPGEPDEEPRDELEHDEAGDPGDEASEPEPAPSAEGGHEGADPLHTDFDHAYRAEVENYDHKDAYVVRN